MNSFIWRYITPIILTVSCTASGQVSIDEFWKQAREASLPAKIFVEWIVEKHDVPPPAELDELRRAVSGHPDHPEALTLAEIERRIKNGPTLVRHRVWIGEGDTFRHSVDQEGGPVDVVVAPQSAWALTETQVTLIDPKEGYPGERNYPTLLPSLRDDINTFVYGVFNFAISSLPFEFTGFSLVNNSWVAETINSEYGLKLQYKAVSKQTTSEAYPYSVVIAASPGGGDVGSAYVSDGWQYNPELGRSIASTIESYAPDGRLLERRRLVAMRPIGREEFREVATPPTFAEPVDHVRGAISGLRIEHDFRGKGDSYARVLNKETGQVDVIVESQFPNNRNDRALTRYGVVAILGLVLAVIGYKVYRSR